MALAPAALAQEFDPEASIRIGSLYEPQNLDNTAGAGQGVNEAFNGNVYEALFQLTDDGTVVPQLVDSYSASEDGLTYTFKLQPGVTFHSGDPLTAADVKYSIERVTAEASKSSRKKSLSTITDIETPDDQTVVITLVVPLDLAALQPQLRLDRQRQGDRPHRDRGRHRSLHARRMAPRLAAGAQPQRQLLGRGPTNAGVVFHYFTDATALNNALLTNAVDVITSVQSPDSLAQFADNPAYKVNDGASTTKEILAFNDRVAPFDNVKVRKAIARAIDNKKLLNSIWGDYGTLIGSIVPPTDPWYDDLTGVNPYDPRERQGAARRGGLSQRLQLHARHPELRSAPDRRAVPAVRTRQGRRHGEHQHHHRQRVVHQGLPAARLRRRRCRSTSTTATSSSTAIPTSTGATTTPR